MKVCKQGVEGVCWCTFSWRSLVSEGRRRSVTRAATYVAESYRALDTNLYVVLCKPKLSHHRKNSWFALIVNTAQ